jgi:hypothetical protein
MDIDRDCAICGECIAPDDARVEISIVHVDVAMPNRIDDCVCHPACWQSVPVRTELGGDD